MSGHTKGPWSYETHELSESLSSIVYDAFGCRVGTDHLTEADARLISSAPDMLEALGTAVNELEWQLERGNGNDVTRAALSIGRAAIAKATNQSEVA